MTRADPDIKKKQKTTKTKNKNKNKKQKNKKKKKTTKKKKKKTAVPPWIHTSCTLRKCATNSRHYCCVIYLLVFLVVNW